MMAHLKQETKVYHEQLEANAFARALMDGSLSRAAYGEMLQRFYGFYRPLEAQLQNVSIAGLDIHARLKTPLLERDLRALGCYDETLPLCPDVPVINSTARALGCMYVLEGATLGGQLIARQLRKLGTTPENGAAFFNSYGENVGEMWKAFAAVTNAYAVANGHEDEMTAAACETFIAFERWLTAVTAVRQIQ
jgi:heme oxygenase